MKTAFFGASAKQNDKNILPKQTAPANMKTNDGMCCNNEKHQKFCLLFIVLFIFGLLGFLGLF